MKANKFLTVLVFAAALSFASGCNLGSNTSSSEELSTSSSHVVDPMLEVLYFGKTTYQREDCYYVSLNDKNYEGEIVIPSSYKDLPVRVIDDDAFADSKITKVTFPDSLYFVAYRAFKNCTSLTEVVFNNGLKIIGRNAFECCNELGTISLPDALVEIQDYGFEFCKKLKVEHWPNQLQTIGQETFYYCENLGDVTLSKSIKNIKEGAFDYSGVVNFTIENEHKLKKLDFCFGYCPFLKSVNIGTGLEELADFHNCESLKNVTLPEGLKIIETAFRGTTALQTISIPSSIERIDSSFDNCTSFQYNTYNNCNYLGNSSNPYLVLMSAIKSNQEEDYDEVLTNVTVHNDCKIIFKSAFKDCRALYQVTLGDNICSLEDYCFSYCKVLTLINLPDSIKNMGYGVFKYCLSLREIALPQYLTTLKDSCFLACLSLRDITINSRLQEIGQSVFTDCSNLHFIDIKSVSTIKSGAFYGCYNLFEVKSNRISLVAGETDYGYVSYYAKQVITNIDQSKLSTDATGVYHYYTDTSDKYLLNYTGGAVEVTVPATVNVLAYRCFYNQGSEVHTINIGTNVTKLTKYCFVTYENALTTINYSGTKDQWRNLTWLDAAYAGSLPDIFYNRTRVPSGVTVCCSDGNISYT